MEQVLSEPEETLQWYEREPRRWQNQQKAAARFLQDVTAGIGEGKQAFIRGTFSLRQNSGHELDRFNIRIVYPTRFPTNNAHPNLYLESHHEKWQNKKESHIEDTWRLCLYIPLESGIDFAHDENALCGVFLALHNFLQRERIYQRDLILLGNTASWPGPDRAHGTAGLIDAIKASGREIGNNDPCICGSGKKYKHCHMHEIRQSQRAEKH